MALKVGDTAPDFELPAVLGEQHLAVGHHHRDRGRAVVARSWGRRDHDPVRH